MSGLLRRIKRSRPADAGEPLPEGQAAAPEGAAPATDPATGPTQPLPGDAPAAEQPAAPPVTEKPVLLADPDIPAGVDPATAPMRPPAGRRGRLRRRLRYLRRARELMLRDLGGLLYEIHRTGGGNVEAHGNIVRAKVQRIAGLDAEAHALETALAAPRAEAVVFQPGVGGTCATCGELYGSAAHFCANCGAPLGATALPAPAEEPAATPTPATRESVFGRPALSSGDPLRSPGPATGAGDDPVVPGPEARAGGAATASEPAVTATSEPADPSAADTAVMEPGGVEAAASDDTVVAEPAAMSEPAAGPAESETAAESAGAAAPEPAGDDDDARAEDATVTAGDTATAEDRAVTAEDPAAPAAEDPAVPAEDSAVNAEDPGAPAEDSAARGEDAGTASEKPDAAATGERDDDAGGNPSSRVRNGRAEDHAAPELSSGDPLVTRETRS